MRFLLILALLGLAPPAAAHEVDRTSAGGTCTVPPLESWSAAEKWAWGEICAGDIADMSAFPGDDAGCEAWQKEGEADTWPETRILSADFIHTIATRHPFTDAPEHRAVRIRCAEVQGKLDMSYEILPQTLWLEASRLPDSASFYKTEVDGDLSFDGSDLGGSIVRADSLVLEGDLRLLSGRTLGIVVIGSKIGGNVATIGSTFTGLLGADRMEVSGGLFMHNGATFAGVDLLGAKIGGDVYAVGSTFTGPFVADGMEVEGSLLMRDGATFEAVRLLGSTIGGNVDAVGSTFTGLFDADGMEVAGSLFLSDGATFEGAVDLTYAEIAKGVQLQGSVFRGHVDFSGASIGQGLVLSSTPYHPVWEGDASLILRNAHAGAVQATMPVPGIANAHHSWRRKAGGAEATSLTYAPLPVDLANFTYDRLGGFGSGVGHDVTRIRPERMIAWIEQSVPPGRTAGDGYVPQPYMQLARNLRGSGAEAAADAVDYARLKHRMAARDNPAVWLADLAAWLFVGFGVYPQRALYWFFGLVAVGWVLTRWSDDLRDRGAFARLFYSLENAVPLIDLSHGFERVTHGGSGIVANFFHFQKIAGFVLATVLVGALTILGG